MAFIKVYKQCKVAEGKAEGRQGERKALQLCNIVLGRPHVAVACREHHYVKKNEGKPCFVVGQGFVSLSQSSQVVPT